MSNLQILLLIAAFLTLTLGSFAYFIFTWDADREPALSFFWPNSVLPEATDLSSRGAV